MATSPNEEHLATYNRESWAAEPTAAPHAIFPTPEVRRDLLPGEDGADDANRSAETPFDNIPVEEELDPGVAMFSGVEELDRQNEYTVQEPTNSLSLLTALARTDPSRDPILQLGAQALEESRQLLEGQQERTIRNQIAARRQEANLVGLRKLINSLGPQTSPEAIAAANTAYQNVLTWDIEKRAKTAIEEEAIDRLQDAAARGDPVQARVLLNNLEKGNADETVKNFNVRMSVLRQRAEELDQEYQQTGWGKSILNFVLNLVPTNYNFARTGIIGTAGLGDFLKVGESLRDQSEQLFNMPMEDFAEFTKRDGELMKSLRDNATTIFDMTHDPAAAKEILDSLITTTDNERVWANVWGGVEVASVVPWTSLTRATRSMVSAGAAKEAAKNLENAVNLMDEVGPEAATRATGVTPEEIVDELSVSAVKPRPRDEVPMSEQVATRRAAAQQALKETFDPPTAVRFNSTEELAAAFEATADDIAAKIGKPIKDVANKTEILPGGGAVHYVEYVFGRKDGHGYATPQAAKSAATKAGLGGSEVIELASTPLRVITNVLDRFEKVRIRTAMARFMESATPETTLDDVPNLLKPFVEATEGSAKIKANTRFHQEVRREISAASSRLQKREWDWQRKLRETEEEVTSDWANDVQLGDVLGDEGLEAAEEMWSELWDELDPFTKKRYKDNPDEAGKAYNEFLQEFSEVWEAERTYKSVESPQLAIARGKGINLVHEDRIVSNDNFLETFQDASGQYFVRGRVNIPETAWYQNKLHAPQQGFLGKTFGRWLRATPRISDQQLHGRALEAGTYINRAHKVVKGNIMSTFGSLPKGSREVVEAIALRGMKDERWFTPEEFSYLTERLKGRAATPVELEAYQKFQLYSDMDFELRNTSLYIDKVAKGKETVTFSSRWGQTFDEDVKIDYSLDDIPKERVYNASTNKHYIHGQNPLTRAELDKLRNEGYVILRLEEPMKLPEDIVTNMVLIKKTDVEIKPLKKEQLAYSPGGHRMYTDPVFVKQGRKGKQPDTGSEYLLSPSTWRTATNIAEGKKWAEVMNRARLALKENPGLTTQQLDDEIFQNDPAFMTGREFLDAVDDGEIGLDEAFEAVWDRDLPSMYQQSGEDMTRLFDEDELGLNGYYRTTGRMYNSSKGEILRNTKGEIAEILDPYDTLSTSLEQITRQMGLQNYKLEAMERFANTYRQWLDIQPNHKFTSQILTEAKVSARTPREMINQIEAQRAAILNVLRFETPADKAARQMWQNTAEWVIGTGDNAARKFAHDAVWWWKQRGPIQQLRGLIFDMKLGMFNPGQLLIQASTMISATALSPKYGSRGMAGLFPMHGYLLSKGSEAYLDAMSKRGVGKVMGFSDEAEFKEYARHLQNHGFADMNGSHVMIRDYGPAAHFGSFGSKLTNVRESGRVFFYTAETWNRLVAYRIAWGEARDKGLRSTDPNFNAEILRLADDYSMNMTSESAAFWQKGILSLPTQFWAYNVRMIDAIFGKRFTPAQRARLALAQMGMAGTAGIPGLAAYSEWRKQVHGESPDIDTVEGVVDRGIIDWLNYQVTGTDILIGERVGTGGWASDTVKALFGQTEYGERSFADVVGGATYSIAKKTAEGGVSILGALAAYAAAESGSDMGERALVGDKFVNMLKEVSTFGNLTKAMMIHQHGLYMSNKGTVLINDLPPSNAIYTILTFRPSKAQEISYLMAWDKNKKESIKEISTQLRNWRQESLTNPDKMNENMAKANALIRMVPIGDRRAVLRQTNSITDKSFYEHVERKVREEKMKEGTAE